MATIIQIKRSTGGGAPTTGTLSEAELAYSQDKSNEGANAILYIESVASDNSPVIHKVGGKYYTDIIDAANVEPSANTLVKRYANGSIAANVVYATRVVGTIEGTIEGVASSAVQLQTPRNITLSGDLEGNVLFDGTSDVTIFANVLPNSVVLGTDTTGDYVQNIAAGTGTTVSGFTGESQTITIGLDNTPVNPGSYGGISGGSTVLGAFIVDQQGRLTSASNVEVATTLDILGNSGTDSVELVSKYFAVLGNEPGIYTTATSNTVTIYNTGVTNLAGTAGEISVDVTTGNVTASLATTSVTAGLYGNGKVIPSFTVDTKGRLTQSSNVNIDLNDLTSNVIPTTNGLQNLGSNDKRFGRLWLSGQTLVLGDIALQDNGGKLAVAAVDGSGTVSGTSYDMASNAYVDAQLATKANVVDLTLEIDGDGSSSNVVNLYNDSLSFVGHAPGNYVTVGSGGLVTVYNTGVTELTSAGHGIVASAGTGNVQLTFTGVGEVTGTTNEIVVSQTTGNIQIGLPDDVTISNNLTVNGNLYLLGSSVSLDTVRLEVKDSLVKFGNANPTDSFDIGFYGQYTSGGEKYAGLYRDVSDQGRFKLFKDLTTDPAGNDINSANFTIATLVANLTGGTVSGLSSAIAVSDGGTGRTSLTANAVLYGNDTGSVSLATGTSGQILQINSDGMVAFGDINGGTY